MMRIRLNQWVIQCGNLAQPVFTPTGCDRETAMAIAVSMYGDKITGELLDEDLFTVKLTNAQLHAADKQYCPECGEHTWKEGKFGHDEKCSLAAAEELPISSGEARHQSILRLVLEDGSQCGGLL